MTERIAVARALVSVSDKSHLDTLARALRDAKVEIVSTGSTAATLREAGIEVTDVATVTGFAEAFDGRVKTLHPAIHGGILADRRNPSHVQQLEDLAIGPIDLVVVNLYPFESTVAAGAPADEVIENIDIGGPAMVRAAAKNFHSVAIVVDPADYEWVATAVVSGGLDSSQRRALAAKAFAHTAGYDAMVSSWFQRLAGEDFPDSLTLSARRLSDLRYGENPHQRAALYRRPLSEPGLAHATVVQGKEMSFNNFLDADSALRALDGFDEPTVAIIKHQNPCGIASADSILGAYLLAHAGDPVSAFGGVIALNRALDRETAEAISEVFTEVIVAPAIDPEAELLLAKKPNVRVLLLPADYRADVRDYRVISGGLLVQQPDRQCSPVSEWTLMAGESPDSETSASLEFAWRAVRSVKSNAILLAQATASVGIGMGQVSRVDSCRLAVSRAGERAHGAVAASDAFFPFADGLKILVEAGVSAVVQPGGSVRDEEVIETAQKYGVTLFHTGERHFLH